MSVASTMSESSDGPSAAAAAADGDNGGERPALRASPPPSSAMAASGRSISTQPLAESSLSSTPTSPAMPARGMRHASMSTLCCAVTRRSE